MHNRRAFFSDLGLGFTGMAVGAMLHADAQGSDSAWSPPTGNPHFAPKAKNVIWIFLSGGYSHMETFDPKPALTKYAGKSYKQTPFTNPEEHPLLRKRSRSVIQKEREVWQRIFPMQVGFKKHGQSGIEMTDWWPHLAECVDDISFVRSMYTTDNDHAAENQIHTGRHMLDESQPSIGSWVSYGLGTMNDNLPQFVVLGGPTRADTRQSFEANYLGPQHAGIPLGNNPKDPLPFGKRGRGVLPEEQRNEFELIGQLNKLTAKKRPFDDTVKARIRSYELAYKMQMAVPEAVSLADETAATHKLYGLDNNATRAAGQKLLTARRFIERGARFVQVYPSRYGVWDSHNNLKTNHTRLCNQVDKPTAGLLKDLKQRGMLNDTIVVFCTEFGRTPAVEARNGNGRLGRDHHPHGFTVWLAGAGLKKGFVHGETDELGFHAIEPGHYVTDLHNTVLHLMGLDSRKLEIPGRKRLDMDHGKPIKEIFA